MSSQHIQWINLDECITAYMNEAELSNHKYFRLWHLSFDGMTQLGLDSFYSIKSIKLPVNANLTVNLPADCLQVSKVGVFNQQGEVIPLSVNNNLSTAFDLQPTRLQQTVDNTILSQLSQQGNVWYNYWNGQTVGNLYGLPSGAPFVGSYKIDNANGLIVLGQAFQYEYVVLEYVPSPIEGGDYYVPIQFKEAIIAYLRWKDKISIPAKTHMDNSNIAMRRRDFYNERRLAIARIDPIDLPQLYEWALKSQRLTVKA
tara:strand:+ start:19206 stop:19976 length:771 start_codon:yes stop_codon:yes gene_type:complete